MPAVAPLTDEGVLNSYTIIKYPSPFFDIANNYIPKNIKLLFRFCRDYFHTNSFLRNVITKLTEYPVTDILYDSTIDSAAKNKWDKILHERIKIKSFLLEMGLDYFTYGNVFVSTMMKSTRFIICPVCKHQQLIKSAKGLKLKNFQIYGTCSNPKCGAKDVPFKIEDQTIKAEENFKLIRWAPENIEIDYNPITGNSIYYYTIPNKIKSAIIAGNLAIIQDIPLEFLEALKTSKRIELNPTNLFHMKFPTLAEEDMGWGKPMILPALKDIYYLQTLRKANEAIANEHAVPKKTIAPANTMSMDPFATVNMGKWTDEVEKSIKRWKIDPNYIAVFPLPMQYQELGGNAKMLMLTPEMRFLEESIINSLGVPLEFIKGGTSWTGSSVSLRIVENHFLSYRELLLDFLNYFLIPKLCAYLDLPPIKVLFKKFKMADDSESKQLAVNLNASGKISDSRLLDEFGYDSVEEAGALKKDRLASLETEIATSEKQAEAQGKSQVILARYQVQAQKAMEDEQLRLRAELFEKELATENGAIPEDPRKLIEKYALELMSLPPDLQSMKLQEMAQNAPVTYSFVIQKINLYTQQGVGGILSPDMMPSGISQKAPNEKGVGKREQDKVKITKADKQHGPTNSNKV